MIKWLVVFMILIVAFSLYLRQQVHDVADVAADAKPKVEVASPALPSAAAAVEPGSVASKDSPKAATLSVADSMLTNRVAPVHEAPLQGEILPE